MSLQSISTWLFDQAPGPPGVTYLGLVALFLAVLVAGIAVYLLRRTLFPGQSLHVRLARRFGAYGITAGAVGLFFLVGRYLALGFLQMRVWLVLSVLLVVALAAYVGWYARKRYPADRAAYERARERDRFVRASAHSPRRRSRKSRR